MLKHRREVITLLTATLAYGVWFAMLSVANTWPAALVIFILALVFALHSSLQHETIHGHPFKNPRLSDAVGYLPIGLFIPYYRFRDLHLAHHNDAILTDPYDDPETNYLDPQVWNKLSPLTRGLLRFNNTLIGRIAVGPAIGLFTYYRSELAGIRAGNREVIRGWVHHLIGLAIMLPILIWLHVPAWLYLTACYFGLSILKIRTFAEHQAHIRAAGRSVVIEDRGLFAFLFLNNCYHSVHHIHPNIAWYDLPKKYRDNREHYLNRNGNYVFKNYIELFRNYFLRRKDDVPHPLYGREE